MIRSQVLLTGDHVLLATTIFLLLAPFMLCMIDKFLGMKQEWLQSDTLLFHKNDGQILMKSLRDPRSGLIFDFMILIKGI